MPPEAACLACATPTGSTDVPPLGTALGVVTLPAGPTIALVELQGGARVLAPCATSETIVGARVNIVREGDRFTAAPASGRGPRPTGK